MGKRERMQSEYTLRTQTHKHTNTHAHTQTRTHTHTNLGYHTRELDLALGARHVVYLAALPLADGGQGRQLRLVHLCSVNNVRRNV